MRITNKKIGIILMLVTIELIGIVIYMWPKREELDDVKLNSINNELFAIMLEQADGSYKEEGSSWPTDNYVYNPSKSGCIDINGNDLKGVLTFDSVNNIATVDTGSTSYCYLYFDFLPLTYAIYSETDNSLTFYNNQDSEGIGDTYNNKAVTAIYTGLGNTAYTDTTQPWKSYQSAITSVSVAEEIKPTNISYWFYNLKNASTLDLIKLNTSNVTDMKYTFYNTGYNVSLFTLKGLDKWDVSNVTNMYATFKNAGYKSKEFNLGDLSNWNVQKLKILEETFRNAGHDSTEWYIGTLSNWQTTSLTSLYSSFREAGNNATSVNLDLSNWDTSKVTHMGSTFHSFGRNSTEWSVGNLSNWNVSKVTSLNYMFSYAGSNSSIWNIGDISNWKTPNVKNMAYMFANAGTKSSKIELDLSGWDTSNVTNMQRMFSDFGRTSMSFTIGDISGWNTGNVTNMQNMFNSMGYNATYSLDLSKWNVSKVVNYSNFNANATSKISSPTWVNENIYIEEPE